MVSRNVGDMSFNDLPEDCIAKVLSFTSPKDAGRLSVLSPTFRSASESDVVWERFPPGDHKSIISKSNSSSLLESVTSKKQLYLSLCDNPILLENGKKSFSLDKSTGKICYMLSARDLLITWGDTPQYWTWNSNPASRFSEVAELIHVCWLEIRGNFNTHVLSPATLYTAYLVFRLSADAYGLDDQPVEVTMKLDGADGCARIVGWHRGSRLEQSSSDNVLRQFGFFNFRRRRSVFTRASDGHYSNKRVDGWLEIELGDFFCKGGEDGELQIRVFDSTSHWKCGLIVEGIEFRPKKGAEVAHLGD